MFRPEYVERTIDTDVLFSRRGAITQASTAPFALHSRRLPNGRAQFISVVAQAIAPIPL